MTNDEQKKYTKALTNICAGENGHYVYALIDPRGGAKRVFYIGEGVEDRVLDHLKGQQKEQERLKKERDAKLEKARLIKDAEKCSRRIAEIETEYDAEFANLSEKYRTIGAIEGSGASVEHVIIKYGMTSQEAFRAESALINLMHFTGSLTNIQGGHATENEKECRFGTSKARTLDEFCKDCAPEPMELTEIHESIRSKAILISINSFAPRCKGLEDYWEAARGCWRMRFPKAQKCGYVFVLHKAVIRGIFKIEPNSVRQISAANPESDIGDTTDSIRPERKDEWDFIKLICRKAALLQKADPSLKDGSEALRQKLYKDPEVRAWFVRRGNKIVKDQDLFLQRKFFCTDARVPTSDEEQALLDSYTNRLLRINGKDYKSPEGSVSYAWEK